MPKVKGLSIKQKKFADALLKSGNGTQAIIEAGYDVGSRETAGAMSSENLEKPNVRAYIESKSIEAAQVIYNLSLNAENENVQLGASKDILDRSGFKPIDKLEITVPKPLMEDV